MRKVAAPIGSTRLHHLRHRWYCRRLVEAAGFPVKRVNKVKEGRPHIVDAMKNGEVALVFTTVDETKDAIADSRSIRTTALAQRITYQTTVAGAEAAVEGMKHLHEIKVYDLQGLHASLNP